MPSIHTVENVCQLLSERYPVSALGNKKDPLDEYLYIILSLRTHEKGFTRAYLSFKKAFPRWALLEKASIHQIAQAIRSGGLSLQKARRIRFAVKLIRGKLGKVSLRKLRRMGAAEAEQFLLQLPGVGLKSARCIMMYSLGLAVLPVDIHVARITRRLGWVKQTSSAVLHRRLEGLVPPNLRFTFHVFCVQHGRHICRGWIPKCHLCCIARYCRKIGLRTAHQSKGPRY